MTTPNSMAGHQIRIKLGDGATPTEAFTGTCMINMARAIEWDADVVETVIPGCSTDIGVAQWVKRRVRSLSGTITGAGIFDADDHDRWYTWWRSGAEKNIQIDYLTGNGTYEGAAICKSYAKDAGDGFEEVTFKCTILTTGEWTFTP